MMKPSLAEQADRLPTEDLSHHDSDEGQYKIGDLAREFGVTLRTLRFYEDRGLVTPERQGTTRLYSGSDKERLRVALFGKRIGLSLGQISSVLDLIDRDDRDAPMGERIRLVYEKQLTVLEERLAETQDAIADLQDAITKL